MKLTREQIQRIMPGAASGNITKYLPWLNYWMPNYGITTLERVRHFLAQIAVESGQLKYNEEIASGEAYDTGHLAEILGNTPEKDGDGQRNKGRGLIQITGASNLKALSKDWGIDVFSDPDLLETPENSVRSACWFWWKKGLNRLADSGAAVKVVTKKVNGGQNGLEQREKFYQKAKTTIL